jgi:hypothetical protein
MVLIVFKQIAIGIKHVVRINAMALQTIHDLLRAQGSTLFR